MFFVVSVNTRVHYIHIDNWTISVGNSFVDEIHVEEPFNNSPNKVNE